MALATMMRSGTILVVFIMINMAQVNYTVEAIDTDGSVTGTAGATYYIETGSNTHNIMNEQGL